jgi:hypothetical protein
MAVVTFHRPTDAGVARSKYNLKVIDGSAFFSILLLHLLLTEHRYS